MKHLLFVTAVLLAVNLNAQTFIYKLCTPDYAGQREWASFQTANAWEIWSDTTKYTAEQRNKHAMRALKLSEKKGVVSGDFYHLLGILHAERMNYGLAGRYWLRGYNKHASMDCYDLRKQMKSNMPALKAARKIEMRKRTQEHWAPKNN